LLESNHRISEDEIIRDWRFNKKDLSVVLTLNKPHRLWVAVQMCSLKLFGQFLDNPNDLASEIISYICKQLAVPITVRVEIPKRDATRTAHKKLIFNHLGFSRFDGASDLFRSWVQTKVDDGIILSDEITPDAEKFLIEHKIAVPTAYKLTREINSVCYNRQEEIYNSIYARLSKDNIDAFNDALNIIEGKKKSWFQIFKEYPGSATITLLKDYLQRYKKISEMELGVI